MRFYKYTTSRVGIKVLRDRLIRFSQQPVLNDPFDSAPFIAEFFLQDQLKPALVMATSDRAVEDFIDLLLTDKYHDLPRTLQSQFALSDWLDYGRPKLHAQLKQELSVGGKSLPDTLIDMMFANTEAYRELMEKRLQLTIANTVGILSVSTLSDRHPLWAHYADGYRGLAIELDPHHPYFSDAREVKYVNERTGIHLSSAFSSEENARETALAMIFTKHTDWSFESEYRMVRPLAI